MSWARAAIGVLLLGLHAACQTQAYVQLLQNAADRGALSNYGDQELADQFTLQSAFAVHQLRWYGSFWQANLTSGATTYPFVIRLYHTTSAAQYPAVTYYSLNDPTTAAHFASYELRVSASAQPAGVPFVGTDLGGDTSPERVTYEFVAAIDGVVLDAATEYWISITAAGEDAWRWANSPASPFEYSVYRMAYNGEILWGGFSNVPYDLQTRSNLAFGLYGVPLVAYDPCTFNSDNSPNVTDVQTIINQALGLTTALHDLNEDGTINTDDVQIALDAALGKGCRAR